MFNPLTLKSINELLGENFYISHYQRGYRWTKQQVTDLLNDIWNFATKEEGDKTEFYCLQPIVVKQKLDESGYLVPNYWEVVDGQQRLTTIYIILSYLTKEFLKVESLAEEYEGREIYTLRYETRPQSGIFLKNITDDNSNIDYHHISNAYKTVKEWFTNGNNTKDRTDKNIFLDSLLGKKSNKRSVQIIWYEAQPQTNSVELFTRLNVGKIPLTNSELIKALFLSSSSFESQSNEDAARKKMEISQLWDEIEQKLSDEHFWSFTTNAKQTEFPTKIELLFNMIAKRRQDEIDPLYTFLHFLKKSKAESGNLWELWLSIERYYLTLCEWYKDKNLYHKVGYLIAVGEHISDLIDLSLEKNKKCFENWLDKEIMDKVNFDIEELSYEKNSDYRKIENLLLLFNVESIRINKSITEFYPFKFHKHTNWSLEHIHAQNSESLDKTKKDPWFKWLHYHEALIEELVADEKNSENLTEFKSLLEEVRRFDNDKLTWEKFSELSKRIIQMFTENSDEPSDDLHSVSNLALLSQPDNAALNNAVFEIKRREIIKMDMEGSYIPICTKRVFLKYYNDRPSTQQYYFWGKEDRKNYLEKIKAVLEPYLPKSMDVN